MQVGLKVVYSVLPLGALAALVVWFVYAGRVSDKKPSTSTLRTDLDDAHLCFQALVATCLIYLVLHVHHGVLMS